MDLRGKRTGGKIKARENGRDAARKGQDKVSTSRLLPLLRLSRIDSEEIVRQPI
jgi:hypothetical protein